MKNPAVTAEPEDQYCIECDGYIEHDDTCVCVDCCAEVHVDCLMDHQDECEQHLRRQQEQPETD